MPNRLHQIAEALRRHSTLIELTLPYWADFMAQRLAKVAKENQPSGEDLSTRMAAGGKPRLYGRLKRAKNWPIQSLSDFTHKSFVDDTGLLRGSIRGESTVSGRKATITVSAPTDYAEYVEKHGYEVISQVKFTEWPKLLEEYKQYILDRLEGALASEMGVLDD